MLSTRGKEGSERDNIRTLGIFNDGDPYFRAKWLYGLNSSREAGWDTKHAGCTNVFSKLQLRQKELIVLNTLMWIYI